MATRGRDVSKERRACLADHWQVLEDVMLGGMTMGQVAAMRGMQASAVRSVVRRAWALGISADDVKAYMRKAK